MITNAKRATVLTVIYAISAIVGIICKGFGAELGFALLFNGVNGIFAVACFKRLRINAFFKLGLFALGVFAVVMLYRDFNANMPSSGFMQLFALLVNIVGLLIILISRATLTRSKTYFLLNLVILPIALIAAILCSKLHMLVGILFSLVVGGGILGFVWYAGGAPKFESEHYYYEYQTSDGRTLRHLHDNCYTDDSGGRYELSSDGTTMSEL